MTLQIQVIYMSLIVPLLVINGKHYSEIISVEGGDKDVYIFNSNYMATKDTI